MTYSNQIWLIGQLSRTTQQRMKHNIFVSNDLVAIMTWSASCFIGGHEQDGQNGSDVGRRPPGRDEPSGRPPSWLRPQRADRALQLLQPRPPEGRRPEDRALPGPDRAAPGAAGPGSGRVLPLRHRPG